MWATVEELEGSLGDQVRQRRLRRDMTVARLAERAGVTPKTVLTLEHGRGSTLTTLIKVLRALDAEEWLATLTPAEPVSPIALRDQLKGRQRRRRASGVDRG